MKVRAYGEASDRALAVAMGADERIIVFGEDVPMIRRELLVRFGPDRVFDAPISESAFLGAAVGAALGGLIPVVEVMLVDFLGVALSALLNEAAKIEEFSGGSWRVPMVVRATCGGGYGDGGQHEQALWGLLGGIAGLTVVVPSTPADAAGLMVSAVGHGGPVVFLEHKLLSQVWLDTMGGAGRSQVAFDVPAAGAHGEVAEPPAPVPIGRAKVVRSGDDLAILSIGVGVHRALEAAGQLADDGIEAALIDLRTIAPLDRSTILAQARSTSRVLVVDEDYVGFGLTGEISAMIAEAGIPVRFARVATEGVIPYARHLEDETLPNVERIRLAAKRLLA